MSAEQHPFVPLRVFYSYAHEDEALLFEFEKHLNVLKQQGLITTWCDRDINPGMDRAIQIDGNLNAAQIILLLVSADFFTSCSSEMERALKRHLVDGAIVIPILIRPVAWEQTSLDKLQVLPRNHQPVTHLERHDEVFKLIVQEIRTIAEKLQRQVIVTYMQPQQTIATHLVDVLEAHNIPIQQVSSIQEQTTLKEVSKSLGVVLIASPKTRSSLYLKEVQKHASMHQLSYLWIIDNGQDREQGTASLEDDTHAININPGQQDGAFQEVLYRVKQWRYRSVFPSIIPHLLNHAIPTRV